jgi:hypothetical protein
MSAPLQSPSQVANAAVQLIGGYNDNVPITGTPPNFDNTKLGIAAGAVYNEVVYTIGRMFGYDFARNIVTLVSTGNTPRQGFSQEYTYPATCLQLHQILPPSTQDKNNPTPINWLVGNAGSNKVIWTNIASAQAEISNTPPEPMWDAAYQEAVVRELAAKLALAGVGKPDFYKEFMEEGTRIEIAAQQRDS